MPEKAAGLRMMERIFSKDRVNTGRQREIDLLKAYSIIMMIITHSIDDLFINYDAHLPSVIIDDILAQSVGAQGFMICMGLGIIFHGSIPARERLKAGVQLLIIGQALNIIRTGLTYTIFYMITGNIVFKASVFLVFSSDILQFAGLFMILTALFAKLNLKTWQVFLISIVCNLTAMSLCMRVSTGSYALDQFLGLFIFTRTESYFPLLHWMIYPAFGMLFGEILMHVKDKFRFYSMLLLPCSVVAAVYFYVGLAVSQDLFTAFSVWQSFAYMSIFDAIPQLFCNTAVICLCYFITFRMTDKAMQPINFVSKNINRYYCVHIVIINIIFGCMFSMGILSMEKASSCYLAAAAVLIITTLIVMLYDRKLARPLRKFFGKHRYFWYGAVLLISLAFCAWSYAGYEGEFPNLLNEYFE